MKFANIHGKRQEAKPGLAGTCPSCGGAVIAKCGGHRVWHWAHKGVRTCDPWWEPETEWHRGWKNEFPADLQEIVQIAQNGEKHVADVKTQRGIVLEFQHSFLKAAERTAREAFYLKMIWIVDGRRRKRDVAQFLESTGTCVFRHDPIILHIANHEECALLRDWNASLVPVYFDLGIRDKDGEPILWRRDPISRIGKAYLTPISRKSFLKVHREGLDAEEKFSEGVRVIVESLRRAAETPHGTAQLGFQRYFTKKHRFRRF